MAISASVVDGKLVYSTTETTETGSTSTKKSSSGSLDKDAFLQLLVAQMKYQDPLEPTSNTEYISQFATFSELEQMQNLSASMDLQRASSLVGEYVMMKVTSETTGETSTILGKVDYVINENNKAYLHINGNDYSIDDLDTIIDKDYFTATSLATQFITSLNQLPTVGNLTTAYKDVIENLRKVYDDMNDYQKSFISDSQLTKLKEYEAKMAELLKVDDGSDDDSDDSGDVDDTDGES
ncbi:MAG: flagellar hook capping FlgD N-terminal domain-containing protein [Lachnospiraceae bacterium]